jgi:hypothetical protein
MLVKHDSSATGISGLFLSTHSGDRHTHHHTHSHR